MKTKFLTIALSITMMVVPFTTINAQREIPTQEEIQQNAQEQADQARDEVNQFIDDNEEQIVSNLKNAYTNVINNILLVIDNAENYMESIEVPENYTCNADQSLIDFEMYLQNQLVVVESVTTIQEFKSIKNSTVVYLQTNSDVIKNSVQSYTDCAYKASVDSIETYLELATLQAEILDRTNQADVTELEDAINQAQILVDRSEVEYANGNVQEAYRLLAETSPYLVEIGTYLV